MMTDSDLNAIATFFVASALVVYFALLVQVCVSVLRDSSIGGLKKAAWLLFLLLVPVLAPMLHVLTRRAAPKPRTGDGLAALGHSEIFVHIRPVSRPSEAG